MLHVKEDEDTQTPKDLQGSLSRGLHRASTEGASTIRFTRAARNQKFDIPEALLIDDPWDEMTGGCNPGNTPHTRDRNPDHIEKPMEGFDLEEGRQGRSTRAGVDWRLRHSIVHWGLCQHWADVRGEVYGGQCNRSAQ
jgi:hypothetical protein